jgi:hypothetical protein
VDDQTFPHVKKALWKMMKKFDITHSGWKLTEEAYNFIEHTESLSRVYSLQEAIQVVRDGISPGIAGNPAVFSNPSTTYPLISVIVIPNLDEGGFKLPVSLHATIGQWIKELRPSSTGIPSFGSGMSTQKLTCAPLLISTLLIHPVSRE